MAGTTISLASGARIEFWARAMTDTPELSIHAGSTLVFQTALIPRAWDFYSYHHRESGDVSVNWEPGSIEVAFAYAYDPRTVNDIGIELWDFAPTGLTRRQGPEIDAVMQADPDRPSLHFSPPQQWMNDPNGLCKVGDIWHMFYQFHPAGTDWGPMHWGHAISRDLFNWTHLPVFLHPEQNLWRLGATGGAFSGNAFIDKTGALCFYYTERLPAYDLFKGYREVQKIVHADQSLLKAESTVLVLEERPAGVEHDFRDPKVWWDEAAGAYRMVLGAAIDGDPAVLLYGSADGLNWTYLRPLYRAAPNFKAQGARAVECPDFFPLDGKWVLVMGFVGYTEPETGRHNLLFALVGDFVEDTFVVTSKALQILDFGTDYYAMQSFEAAGRQIAFAWLFNWEYRKPGGSPYSGEMSLPRELSVDETHQLCMRPADELESAVHGIALTTNPHGKYDIGRLPFDIQLAGALDGTTISARLGNDLSFEIKIDSGTLSVRLPQDDGKISYTAKVTSPSDLRVIHDCGVIEVFACGGAVCGTRRNYVNTAPDSLSVTTNAKYTVVQLERR